MSEASHRRRQRPIGNYLRHRGKVYRVLDVRAYRDTRIAEDRVLRTDEGYRYRLPARATGRR
jgi:hypothetical protein